MKLYIFRCRTRPRMYGATRYETGSNLPTQCSGGWEFSERVDLSPRGRLRFAVDTDTVRRQVDLRGWHVWDESPYESRVEKETKPPAHEPKPTVEPRREATARESAPIVEPVTSFGEQFPEETADAIPPVEAVRPERAIEPPRPATVASSIRRESPSLRTTQSAPA